MKNSQKKISLAKKIMLFGILLIVVNYVLESIIIGKAQLEESLYLNLAGFVLFYFGARYYIMAKEKKPLKKSFLYAKKSKWHILAVMSLFVLSGVIGYVAGSNLDFYIKDIIKEIVEKTQNMNNIELIIFIFLNNTIASIVGIFGGLILLLPPLLSSIGNGILIGYITEKVGIKESLLILPHGIFELPAIFISFGLGIKLGLFIISKNMNETLKDRLYGSFLVFITIIIPLLAVAALIEGILIAYLG